MTRQVKAHAFSGSRTDGDLTAAWKNQEENLRIKAMRFFNST